MQEVGSHLLSLKAPRLFTSDARRLGRVGASSAFRKSIGFVLLILTLASTSAAAQPVQQSGQMTRGWAGMMGWGSFGWLGMLIFWSVIFLLLILIARSLVGRSMGSSSRHDALAILRERFAKGEITKEEFEERRNTLFS